MSAGIACVDTSSCPKLRNRIPVAMALTLLLVLIWLLTHRYQGLAQDARLYAVQALARISPQLQDDLYLQNTSQDRYTVFSPFYAAVIRVLGLHAAARTLTVMFAAWFLLAAWNLAKGLVGSSQAWLATGALILSVGAYGSYGVFHFSEDYLSARSAAEALTLTAFALHARGLSLPGLLVAAFAMLVHPLMALPGLLLLVFWRMSTGTAVALAVLGVALVGAVALLASLAPPSAADARFAALAPGFAAVLAARLAALVPRLDPAWLHIVRERSQFLFLQLWTRRDWEVNLRPFATLAIAASVLDAGIWNARISKLCIAAALVGACGLTIALLVGTVGDVALLIQGQAWRWVWVTACIAQLLLMPTALRLWQNKTTGPLCALLLLASWTLSIRDAPTLALGACGLFWLRPRIPATAGDNFKLAAMLLGVIVIGWQLAALITTASSVADASTGVACSVYRRFPIAVLLLATWFLVMKTDRRWLPAVVGGTCVAASAWLIPVAFAKIDAAGSAAEVAEFADWTRVIPPTANVYLADGRDAASFAWFTLRRPSYLSLDQSAGVVFSQATAAEVARRSQVLLPLLDEDWKLLSRNTAVHRAGTGSTPRRSPLTAASLESICHDPQLGFVMAREDVGFGRLQNQHAGSWLHWNLYDCALVRGLESKN